MMMMKMVLVPVTELTFTLEVKIPLSVFRTVHSENISNNKDKLYTLDVIEEALSIMFPGMKLSDAQDSSDLLYSAAQEQEKAKQAPKKSTTTDTSSKATKDNLATSQLSKSTGNLTAPQPSTTSSKPETKEPTASSKDAPVTTKKVATSLAELKPSSISSPQLTVNPGPSSSADSEASEGGPPPPPGGTICWTI
jgi:hypothetical protein